MLRLGGLCKLIRRWTLIERAKSNAPLKCLRPLNPNATQFNAALSQTTAVADEPTVVALDVFSEHQPWLHHLRSGA